MTDFCTYSLLPSSDKNVAGWWATFPHWPQGGTKALTGCAHTGTDYRPTALCCQLLSIICPWTLALLSSSVCAHCSPYCAAHKLNVFEKQWFPAASVPFSFRRRHIICAGGCMPTLVTSHFGYLYIWLMHISADNVRNREQRSVPVHAVITFTNDYISGSYLPAHMAAKKGRPSSSEKYANSHSQSSQSCVKSVSSIVTAFVFA